MKMTKRVLALSLALALIFGLMPNLLPVKASAAEEAPAPVVVWENSFEVGETFEYVEAQNVPTTSDVDAHWNNAAPKVEDDFFTLDHVSGGNVFVTGGVDGAYDGDSCIKLDGEGENSRLYLNYGVTNAITAGKISLVDGKKYVASVWVKFDEASNMSFQLMVKNTADATNPKEILASKNVAAGQWTQIFLPFTYKEFAEGENFCQIDMQMLSVTNGAVYLDKLQILEAEDATGIALDKTAAEVKAGSSIQLTAGLNPATATDKVTYTWESANSAIASVDQTGKVSGVSVGETTITVTAKKYEFNYSSDVRAWVETDTLWTAQCTVTVAPASLNAPIAVWEDSFEIGETFEQVDTKDTPTTSDADACWNDAAPKKEYDFFLLDHVSGGGVYITAGVGDAYDGSSCIKMDGGTDSGRVYLTYNAYTGVTKGKIALVAGEEYVASVWVKFDTESVMTFELMVKGTAAASNPKTNVASKNVAAGEWMQIFLPFTYTTEKNLQIVMEMLSVTNGAVYLDNLQILKAEEATGIALDKTSIELDSKESVQLTAGLNPVTATNKVDYAWSSSDSTVATVDQKGNVTGISTGTATITVNASVWEYDFEGRAWVLTNTIWTASCAVKVTAKSPVIVFEDSFEIGDTFTVEGATNLDITAKNDDNWYGAAPTDKDVFEADLYSGAPSAKATGGVSGAFDGDSCIKLEAPAGNLLYMVYNLKNVKGDNKPALKNNTMYVLSVWVKYDSDSGDRYSQMQIKNTTAAVEGGNTGPRVDGGKNLTEWTKIEVPFLYTDANEGKLTVNLNMQSKNGTGAVYFDLLQITELVEATADFTVSGAEQALNAGDKVTLKPNMTPANASTTIVWTSSNPSVATVDAKGVVTAVSAGSATITAKAIVKQYDFVNRKYIENKATYVGTCDVTVNCAHEWDNGVINPDATCDSDGVITYTCALCSATKTEAVSAKGHTPGETYRENETSATCTKRGYYDLVTKCSVCEAEISRKTIAVLALGHSYNVVVIEPTCLAGGYTTYDCTTCGNSYIGDEVDALDHEYDNDSDPDCNLCGETREVGPIADSALKFMQSPSLSFQDYIGMQVLMTKKLANKYDKVYVEAVQVTPEGEVTTILNPITYMTNYYVFDQQIMAWSMTETVTLTLYAEKDGKTYVGQTYTQSVESLALAMMQKYSTNTTVCQMLVDMLNYGAAVQTQFSHNAESLPNTQLGDFAAMGSTNIPECDATNSKTGTATVKVINDSVSMQAKVEIQLVIKGAVTATPKATIGTTVLNPVLDTTSIKGYTVIRVAVGATQLRETVTIALYDENDAPVTQVYNVSVEGYAVTAITGSQKNVVIAMMRYGDSVTAYANK